ncbi:hypothetical protein AGMMS49983_14560 [Clostridia bacterium]|nr:hypothetical protein AGMMS49983_14560 [Clostridia bacterium]
MKAKKTTFLLLDAARIFMALAVLLSIEIALSLWLLPAYAGRAGLVFALLLTVPAILLILLYRRRILIPYQKTERLLLLFSEGYSLEGVAGLTEHYSPTAEKMVLKFSELLSSDEAVNLTKRQAQFLAMQNQINPHFLYNTLEGIRGEALASGNAGIAKMTESFSEFFRYTISNLENLVTLEDELTNVKNYFNIQHYRFGDRISMETIFESEEDKALLINAKVPKLILQPIVENAIIHGIEKQIGEGKITIRIVRTEKRLLITVSDNGVGIDGEVLRELNERISNMYERFAKEEQMRGGIALANVNSRIKLLFGEDYGIYVLSTQGIGTDVQITLPYLMKYDLGM